MWSQILFTHVRAVEQALALFDCSWRGVEQQTLKGQNRTSQWLLSKWSESLNRLRHSRSVQVQMTVAQAKPSELKQRNKWPHLSSALKLKQQQNRHNRKSRTVGIPTRPAISTRDRPGGTKTRNEQPGDQSNLSQNGQPYTSIVLGTYGAWVITKLNDQ